MIRLAAIPAIAAGVTIGWLAAALLTVKLFPDLAAGFVALLILYCCIRRELKWW